MKKAILLIPFLLIGAGCTSTQMTVEGDLVVPAATDESTHQIDGDTKTVTSSSVVNLPIENYVDDRTFKAFGEFIDDRFFGYHVADDVEVDDLDAEYPVYAIANGTVRVVRDASGYGGVILITHTIDGEIISAIYGHVDLTSTTLVDGDVVERGQFLANLGDHESEETDGARKHLHFGLYEGDEIRLQGYEEPLENVVNWINPQNFFIEHGVDVATKSRLYDAEKDLGGAIFNLSFEIPAGWELEYIPSIESLNLFTLEGEGTARDRSQVFIRYFDASSFLTLSTVKIYETEDLTVGQEDYVARRYDIEKNAGVADFVDQPAWRNERHIVTDFRAEEGQTRYFVVAANPGLDTEIYEDVLASMKIIK